MPEQISRSSPDSVVNMAGIAEKQSHLNRSTRGQWHLYASHRQQLERLLVPASPGGRICILGAGNCNDLDLRWLTEVYREVQLVDIDPDALARAAKFQKVQASAKIQLRGGIDLTGLSDRLGAWAKNPPEHSEIQTALQLAAQSPAKLAAELNGPFDVVLSPCVLSQLLTPLRDTVGEAHKGFLPMLSAIRARHFRLMLELLAPSGRGVFACDLFSNATFTDLARISHDQLPSLMRTMLNDRKFYTGLDPASMTAVLTRDPAVSATDDIRLTHPWLWHLGLSKCYLVYGITFRK
jgi:hypothetical protein